MAIAPSTTPPLQIGAAHQRESSVDKSTSWKITTKIAKAQQEGRIWWSFEYFPPRTPQGLTNLYDRIERMSGLGPEFVDITWNAGGRTSDLTAQLVKTVHTYMGLETCMHLTCTNMPREKVDTALREAKKFGCRNILACVVIHLPVLQNGNLMQLVSCADFIFTQMFYDYDIFARWVKDVRAAGIDVPIVPGVMPIQNYGGYQRATARFRTIVPESFKQALDPIKMTIKRKGRELWGEPTDLDAVKELFCNFCRGKVTALPWSETPIAKETTVIDEMLQKLNSLGFLTINSQPAVDGAPSDDPVHGWGPKHGYVYQKAYLEFFVHLNNWML
ncbi:hypothetical protein L7F22_019035 [Adiantum nelumboides]|nr:hypothetical protein [Adiantum nelumboides]